MYVGQLIVNTSCQYKDEVRMVHFSRNVDRKLHNYTRNASIIFEYGASYVEEE